jgi:uncharacterized protein
MHHSITKRAARRIWLTAQGLDRPTPFGDGADATRRAIEHLGYVQIDTINVIERCHHHILFTRIPTYQRSHLHQAQSIDKSVFEYWTHALAYVPTRDFRYHVRAMRDRRAETGGWFGSVTAADQRKVLSLLKRTGPLTIRDIDDDELVEKTHPWASRKPSKKALQLAFYSGKVTVSARTGMLKTYDLIERHFGWDRLPSPASERDITAHLLDRALRAQGIVSLDSICYLDAARKPAMRRLIEARVRRGELLPVTIEGCGTTLHWAAPETLAEPADPSPAVHILSPFDPLIIQRKRLALLFDYQHRFEAYVPQAKRVLGYFALPVLSGDEIVAALDLKTDRQAGRLLIRKWTWIGKGRVRPHKRLIEAELDRFERFQLADVTPRSTETASGSPP